MSENKDIFSELRRRWQVFKSQKNRQQRGLDFELWLCDLFQACGLQTTGSFRRSNPNEQIDGAIQYGLTTFLIEAKWESDPLGSTPVDRLRGKVNRSVMGTFGILISVSSFNESAVETAASVKPIEIFLIDVAHLDALLE